MTVFADVALLAGGKSLVYFTSGFANLGMLMGGITILFWSSQRIVDEKSK